MPVTLINPFEVPADREDEFLRDWKETSDGASRAPGFIETRLHRNTGTKDCTFLYVNVAVWENEAAYHAAFRDFAPTTRSIPGIVAYPGLFEVAIEISGCGSPEKVPAQHRSGAAAP